MAGTVRAEPDQRRLTGDGWSLRAERLDLLGGQDWRALIGVRRDLSLLVTPDGRDDQLEVEAWAGEPGDSDGVAVIIARDGILRLARIPLCGCGERGCGNAGLQFGGLLDPGRLPELVAQLRDMVWTDATPARGNVLTGTDLPADAES